MSKYTQQEEAEKKQAKIKNKKVTMQINDQLNPKKGEANSVFKLMNKHKAKVDPVKDELTRIKNGIEIEEVLEELQEHQIEKVLAHPEVPILKNGIVNVMTLPYHQNVVKREILRRKLVESNMINDFVNKNLIFQFMTRLNDNVKFGLTYGMKVLETEQTYKILMAQQPQQIAPVGKKDQESQAVEEVVEPEIEVEKVYEKNENEEA